MTPQHGFNVAKPSFQFTFEPGFVDGCNLIYPCQLLKLMDQVLVYPAILQRFYRVRVPKPFVVRSIRIGGINFSSGYRASYLSGKGRC
jgi:hypothetical protein